MGIMFLERHDEEKRKRGARATRHYPNRPVPFDFAEGCRKCDHRMIRLVEYYGAGERTIRRWVKETGIVLKTMRESIEASRPGREFDPALDNALLRQTIAAMVGRAT